MPARPASGAGRGAFPEHLWQTRCWRFVDVVSRPHGCPFPVDRWWLGWSASITHGRMCRALDAEEAARRVKALQRARVFKKAAMALPASPRLGSSRFAEGECWLRQAAGKMRRSRLIIRGGRNHHRSQGIRQEWRAPGGQSGLARRQFCPRGGRWASWPFNGKWRACPERSGKWWDCCGGAEPRGVAGCPR